MNEVLFFKIDSGDQTRAQILAKISQLDALIFSLYNTALVSVGNANIAEYELDTGQDKQKVKYTSPDQVIASIQGYEKLRQLLQNKLTSSVFRLMDNQNLRR